MNISIFEGREYIEVDIEKMYREFYEKVTTTNEPVEEIKNYYKRLKYVSEEYKKRKHPFDDDIFTKI